MKIKNLITGVLLLTVTAVAAATNDLTSALQKGLFEEEANHNLEAAAAAYQNVSAQFDKDRKLAATAIFRLGEVYRKQGKTNEATAQYERIVREFSDQNTLVTLSRQNLAGLRPRTLRTSRNLMPMDQLRLELERARMQVAEIDALPKTNHTAALVGLFQNDEVIQVFTKQRDALTKELETLRKSHSEDSPVINAAKRQLQAAEAGIDERATEREKSARSWLASMEQGLQQREALEAVESGTIIASAPTDDEEKEIRRIQEMIKNSPELLNTPGRSGATPLHEVARKGQLHVCQFLLNHGAEINATEKGANKSGWTPLHFAAGSGQKAIVELLLANGAKVDAAGKSGDTPLHAAAQRGYVKLVEIFLTHGAAVNAKGFRDQTPLYRALSDWIPAQSTASDAQFATVKLLVAKGADVNARDTLGSSPLHVAAKNGAGDCVELLLQSGADASAITKQNKTPTALAAQNGHREVAEFLARYVDKKEKPSENGAKSTQKGDATRVPDKP